MHFHFLRYMSFKSGYKRRQAKINYFKQETQFIVNKRENEFHRWDFADWFQASCPPRTREDYEPVFVTNELSRSNLCKLQFMRVTKTILEGSTYCDPWRKSTWDHCLIEDASGFHRGVGVAVRESMKIDVISYQTSPHPIPKKIGYSRWRRYVPRRTLSGTVIPYLVSSTWYN